MVLTITCWPLVSYCQSDSLTHKNEKSHSLYAGFNIGSNLIYLGSTISGNEPYYSPSLTYAYKDHLFLSVSATHVPGIYPYVAFGNISASYTKTVNSWFDYSASLGYYKTADSLKQSLFQNFGFGNITTGFDWKILYTKISFTGIISETASGYTEIRNSHYFQTGQFFNNKAFLSFDPSISLLFGTLVNIDTSTGISKFRNLPFLQSHRKLNTTTTYSYYFGLVNTGFSLPVTLNFTNFSIEAEPLYILPTHSESGYPALKGFSFNITAYFKIL